MKITEGQFLYRTESRIARDGSRWTDTFRRDVISIDGKGAVLGPVQKATAPEGEEPKTWEPWGGIFGSQTKVSADRLPTLDYKPRKRCSA
jgi:hypothetical protein